MMKCQISKACIALMYMEHKHIVYREFHILPYIVLDQNTNDNAYPDPLRHGVCNVDHKRVMMVIDFCYNNFSHL